SLVTETMNDGQTFVQKIIDQRIPCLFISPHLDDAVLSAGSLIAFLADKAPVKVVTIFTEASSLPHTRLAKAVVRNCGLEDAFVFVEERKKEDRALFQKLNVPTVHLGFIDAPWRKRQNMSRIRRSASRIIPEFGHLYHNIIQSDSGRIHS